MVGLPPHNFHMPTMLSLKVQSSDVYILVPSIRMIDITKLNNKINKIII